MKIKLILFILVFIIFINNTYSFSDNTTTDFRGDIGYITYNQSNINNERGFGSWISKITDNFLFRFNIINYDVSYPSISLISPENNAVLNTREIDFTYNLTDDNSITNCTLNTFLDSTNTLIIDFTTTLNISKTQQNTITQSVNQDGIFNWRLSCTDIYNNFGNSTENRFFKADTVEGEAGSAGGGSAPYTILLFLKDLLLNYKDVWDVNEDNVVVVDSIDNNNNFISSNINIESVLTLKEIKLIDNKYNIILNSNSTGEYNIKIKGNRESVNIEKEIKVKVVEKSKLSKGLMDYVNDIRDNLTSNQKLLLLIGSVGMIVIILIVVITLIIKDIRRK